MLRFALLFVLCLPACKASQVMRQADTFTVETLAALARQEEAADALLDAADAARAAGDLATCKQYAEPALLISASAELQAHRALWLAGLPYPEDGEIPPRGTEQPDPGPSNPPKSADAYCAGE